MTSQKLGAGNGLTLTRLHFRYDRDHFPEDLVLQETGDTEPFKVQFTVRHAATNVQCDAGQQYLAALPSRREREAQALATLTRWDLGTIRQAMSQTPDAVPAPVMPPPNPLPPKPPEKKDHFWDGLWK
jgi:hypothetical protein